MDRRTTIKWVLAAGACVAVDWRAEAPLSRRQGPRYGTDPELP